TTFTKASSVLDAHASTSAILESSTTSVSVASSTTTTTTVPILSTLNAIPSMSTSKESTGSNQQTTLSQVTTSIIPTYASTSAFLESSTISASTATSTTTTAISVPTINTTSIPTVSTSRLPSTSTTKASTEANVPSTLTQATSNTTPSTHASTSAFLESSTTSASSAPSTMTTTKPVPAINTTSVPTVSTTTTVPNTSTTTAKTEATTETTLSTNAITSPILESNTTSASTGSSTMTITTFVPTVITTTTLLSSLTTKASTEAHLPTTLSQATSNTTSTTYASTSAFLESSTTSASSTSSTIKTTTVPTIKTTSTVPNTPVTKASTEANLLTTLSQASSNTSLTTHASTSAFLESSTITESTASSTMTITTFDPTISKTTTLQNTLTTKESTVANVLTTSSNATSNMKTTNASTTAILESSTTSASSASTKTTSISITSTTLASATSISPRTTTVQLATSTGTLVTNGSISTSSTPANISFGEYDQYTIVTQIKLEDTPAPLPGDVVVSCGNSSKADIIFLLDASSSVTEPNWKKIVKFSSDLVLNFIFGSDSNLFGAVIFNSQATKKFDLNTYHNKTAVANALLAVPYPFTSGTNTASALSFILTNNTFGTSSGGRDDAQNILIVITDGQSSNPNQTIIAAQNLKDAGISIVTIGIGLADLHEITAMASQHDFVFNISNFDVLSIINKDLLQITCDISNGFTNKTTNASTTRATTRDVSTSQSITTLLVTKTTSTQASSSLASATSISPRTTTVQLATSTGTLVTNGSISTSSTPANISFEDTPAPLPGDVVVSCGNSSKADIIFLLDASSSVTEPNWKKIVKFSSDLVLNFIFGSDSNLFGAVIFNSQATKKFDLNTYHNKTAVANALLAVPYPFTSGTNTASALSFILTNNTFGTSSGGRDDAQNILIVITDGQSSNPNQTIIAAQNLKDAGISIVTIGIGLADLHEITAMASQHDFVFNISNFDVLSIINKDLLQITCDISNGFTNKTTNASTTRATTRDVSTSQSITTLLVTKTTSTQASSSLASATSISPRTTTVQLATSTGTLVTNGSISTSSTPANISFEDTPAPLPGDVVVSCGNSSKADIIFLLDASSSVTEPNWKKIVKFSSDLVLNFIFGSDSNLFGAVIFNSQATKKFDLNTYHNKTAVANALLAVPYPFTSGTNTASALSFILTNNTFGTSSGGRDDAQNILIVITDGQSSNPNQTIIAAQNLKDAGISIVTIGIGLADLHEITAMASQHDFVFNISNFDVLSIINKDLLQITCDISNGFTNKTTNASTTRATTRDVSTSQSITTLLVTKTTSTQASSSLASATSISPRTTTVQLATSTGTLVTNGSISTSSTPANISFEDTPAPLPGDVVVSCGNSSKADIIFLLDASSSVTEPNWKKIVKFSSDLVLNFIFGSDSNLFGAVIFNSQATKKFDLNTYHNKTAVANALLAVPYPFTSGTNTASALSFILTNNTFGTSSGGRDDAQNILIVITDGQSSNPNQTIIAAQNLKDAGISIVTIGIGLADLHEITAMASQHDFVFNISNFDVLSIINKDLLQITCDISNGFTNKTTNASTTRATTRDVSTSQSITTLLVTKTTSTQASSSLASATSISPRTTTVQLATSTGTLVTNGSISTSSTPANISFEDTPAPLPGDVVVSCGNSSKADIIFLLDASSSVTEPNWKKIVKFSSDLVLNFIFGSDSNLFGAVIFNSQATKKFDLNTYHNKTAVANALLAVPYPFTSGTNTASALSFILTNNTFGTSSGGRDDAQNILIVITDGQSSNPNQTIIAAQNLKDAGISIVTIGIGLADLHEITAMASQHDFVFNISNFDVLSIINKDLLQITCDISNGFTNKTTNASTTRATTRDVSTSQSITTLLVTKTTSTQASSSLASATSISPRTTTVQLATSTGTLVTNGSISTSSTPANISFEDTPAPLPGDVVVSCGNSSKADIIFLLDASSSVTEPNWKKIVKFSSDLVLNFIFGSDSNLFGAVIFNSQATKKFDLNTYHNKTAVANALLAVPYPFTSGTNTASALSFILTNNTFGTSSGGRDDAQNILIVITDGQSSNPNQTIIAAQNLKDAGISIVTIGIGLADLHEITAMASQHDFVFNISNFDVLSIINKDLLQITCDISNGFTNKTTNASTTRATTRDVSTSQSITTLLVTKTTSTQASSSLASATSISPRTTTVQLATSTGTLVTNGSISTSSTPANISFEDTPAPLPGDVVVSCGNSSKADIIFLLDASSSVTEPNWKKIVKFSSDLVLNFIFGSDSNLFGAVIFNSQATKKFDLNTYHNKTAVANALLAVPYPFTSGTNTASALSFILTNNTFGTSSGGRDDAQNILIVITDGQSSNPNQTIIAAQNLKDAGISIVTIGIGLADLHEITAMASQHDFVFNISNFDVLSIINKDLLQITCDISNGFTNKTTNASTTRATTRDVSTSQSITTLLVTKTTSTQASSSLASATSISPRTTTVQLATSTGTLVTNGSISTSSTPANISFEDTPAPLPGDVVVSCGNSSKADIIFLLDASSSVTEPNWKKIVKFSSDLVLNFIFGSDSNLFGAVIFNSQATKKFDLNTYHNKTAVANALLAVPYPFTSGTNTASALSFILTNNTFGTSSGGRDDAQNILIVITDGQSSNPNQTIIAAQNLKDAGISIVTIGIGLADLHEITAMASQHDFVFNISNFDVLSIINKDLLQITCDISNGFTNKTTNASTTRATTRDVSTSQSITTLLVTKTTSTQASSSLASATSISPRTTTVQLATSTGTLVTNGSISTSSTPANISFEDTPAPLPGDVVVSCGNSSKADIIFLLDASSSVTEPNWKKIVKFSSDLVLNFIFGSDSNLFGAVIFNSQATKKFDLNTYHNKTAVANALLAVPYPFTSGTNTASALSFILTNNTFGTSSGGRDDAQNILIVITDGQSSNPNQTIIAAQNLKDAGISIVTIGIGLADLHEITAMASQHDFVFNISNFDVLSIINKDLLQITCDISNGFTNKTTNASTTRATTRDVSTSQSITTLLVTKTTSTQASSSLASATSISPRTTTVQLATSTGTLVTNGSISTSSTPANISFEDTPAPLPGDVVVSCGNSSKADIIFLLDASSSVTEPNWKKIVKFSSDLVLNFIFGSDSNLFGAVIFNSQATKKFDLNTYHNKTAVANALLAVPYPFTSGTNTASALSFILTNNTFGTSSGGRDDAQNILIVITDGQSSNPNQTIIAAQNLKDAGISIVTIGIGLADLHEITAMASQHDFVFNISNFDVLSIINKDLLQITCDISNGFTNKTTNASTTRATTRDVSTSQSITTLLVTKTTSTQASSSLASATSISPRTTTVQLATSTGTLVTNGSISTSSTPANISFEDTPAPLPGDVVVSCGNSSKADIIFLLDASSSVTEPNWKKIVKFSSDLVLNFIFGSDSNLFGAVIFNSQATKKFDLNTYHNKTAVANALLAVPYPFTSGTNTASALSFILTNNTFGTSSGGRDDAQNILIVITDGQSSNPNQTIIAAQNLKDAGISIVTIGIGLADLHEITAMASQHDFVFNISNFDVLSIINKDLLQITCDISNGFTNKTTNASTTRATTRDVSTSQSITTLLVTKTTSTQASSSLASATSISPRTTTVQLATSTGTLVTNGSISTSSTPANISFEDTPAPLPGDVVVSCGNSSKADIVFLLDASSSVTEPNWKKIVKFSSDLVLNFIFGSDSNLFGAVIFNSQATKKFDLNTYHNKTAVANALLAVPYPFTSGTNTASALSFILTNNTFGTSSGGRDDAQNILIVITDGQSSNPNQTIIAAQNLKDAGISIVTIGIGLADLHEITAMASQHDFVFNISNFDVLSIINKDLLQITCDISNGFTNKTTNASTTRATTRDVSTSQSITTLLVTKTTSTQASSSLASATSISPRTTTVQLATSTGTLVTNGSISTSSTPANISFEDTPAPLPGDVVVSCGNSSKADIIFLLDASSSVTEPNWKKIVKFSSDLVLNFIFGSDSNLFGAVIFNSQATKKFDLNTYHNKTAVANALLAVPYPFTSGTNTASALSFILTNNTFGTSSGGRDDAQNILIVITDGQSSNPNQTIIAAQNLKDAGISIVTIGIGLADLHEITAMASQHDFVFNISNFDVLSIINKDLLQITCDISNGFTNKTTNASTTRATTRDVSTSQSITTLLVTKTTSTQASSSLASATSISPRTTTVQLATSTGTLVFLVHLLIYHLVSMINAQ
ncbi:collagen alpha-1(XII) chain, partial [Biomphalaria pfeifferi]